MSPEEGLGFLEIGWKGETFMRWMDDLKVGAKLLIFAVIAAVGLLAVGLAGYFGLRQVRGDVNEMYTSSVQGVDYAGQALSGMRYAQGMAVITTTVKNDPQRLQDLKGKYESGAKMVDEGIANYEAIPDDDDTTDGLMASAQSDWKSLKGVLDQVVDLSLQGRQDEALALYSAQGSKLAASMGKSLEGIRQNEHDGAAALDQATDDKIASIIATMSAFGVLAFLLVIGAAVLITKKITHPLQTVDAACLKMRDGDFRDTGFVVERRDEFGEMMQSFVDMRTKISGLLKQTNETAQQLAASSEELTASAHQSAQASDQVAQSVTRAAELSAEAQTHIVEAQDSVGETAHSVGLLNDAADTVAKDSATARSRAVDGGKNVQSAVSDIESVDAIVTSSAETVTRLGERSKEIGTIVETISGIADQTNLLALNAAIEAARAGEHGRGFAVVADEVRKLAEQSQEAAKQITDLVTAIQGETDNAVTSIQRGRDAVKTGTAAVSQLKDTFQQIQDAVEHVASRTENMVSELKGVDTQTGSVKDKTEQVSAGSGKIVDEMQSVSAASEEQSASASEIATASDSLAQLAQKLSESLQEFKY